MFKQLAFNAGSGEGGIETQEGTQAMEASVPKKITYAMEIT